MSFSTASVSGAAALLLEHYNDLNDELPNDSALIKGMLIHSAAEFGTASGPDSVCGWGLINAKDAAQLITEEAFMTSSISQGNNIDAQTFFYSKQHS